MQLLPDAELSKSCYPLANALLKVPFLKKKTKKKELSKSCYPPANALLKVPFLKGKTTKKLKK